MKLSEAITNRKYSFERYGEMHALERWAQQAAALEAENARLRELVAAQDALLVAHHTGGSPLHAAAEARVSQARAALRSTQG